MVTDSAKQHIARELRELRKLPGQLDRAKVTHARAILRGFGGDDPEVALARLIDLAEEHAGDRDIEAAMASMGWGVDSDAALDRLSEFSERHFVDPRTVRRWSDAGIQKLTLLILGSAPWLQPRARQVLVADDGDVKIGLDLRIPPNLTMSAPELWVGDRQLEIRLAPLASTPEPQRLRSDLEPLASVSELPIRIRLNWSGEKFPIYEAVTRATPDVYFNSRIVFRDLRTTISRWPGDELRA